MSHRKRIETISKPAPAVPPVVPPVFKMPVIQPFAPPEVQQMKLLEEQNNLYAGVITQMQAEAANLRALETIKAELNTGKVRITSITIPYGIKDHRRHLMNADQPEYVKGLDEALGMVRSRIKTIEAQLLHRADELGGERFKILYMLFTMMVLQHGQDPKELGMRLTNDYLELIRVKQDPDAPFQQAPCRAMQRDMTALLKTAEEGLR